VSSQTPEPPPQSPKPGEKGVMGNQPSGGSRKTFLRELKRAARALLDKRSPQG
jgi:hypothetical protein